MFCVKKQNLIQFVTFFDSDAVICLFLKTHIFIIVWWFSGTWVPRLAIKIYQTDKHKTQQFAYLLLFIHRQHFIYLSILVLFILISYLLLNLRFNLLFNGLRWYFSIAGRRIKKAMDQTESHLSLHLIQWSVVLRPPVQLLLLRHLLLQLLLFLHQLLQRILTTTLWFKFSLYSFFCVFLIWQWAD